MARRALLLCAACCLLSSAAFPQTRAGGEFRANTYTTNRQTRPSVSMDAQGRFVATWNSFKQDQSNFGVFGQRYDADGAPLGPEFRVNNTTNAPQYQDARPAAAHGRRGDYLLVWHSAQDGSGFGVFGRRYDASGAPLGDEFQINQFTGGDQYAASVAASANGFVVAWVSDTQDGEFLGVFARRLDRAGRPLGPELQVNTFTAGDQAEPSVGCDAAGNFVVAWTSEAADGDGSGVFARRFTAAGSPQGVEFVVNQVTSGEQAMATVASDAAGGFLVAWTSDGQDGSGYGVFARRYLASGAPDGGELQVSQATTGEQYRPSASCDENGNCLLAWTDEDGDGTGVSARRYNSLGGPRGSEFRVNTTTGGEQTVPAARSDASGNFVVSWVADDGSSSGVFAQRFGGLVPAALAVDPAAGSGSDGNRMLEPCETVAMEAAWRNANGAALTFDATLSGMTGPAGAVYTIQDGAAAYGTAADGSTRTCSECYRVQVSCPSSRPALHWDTAVVENLTPPDQHGQSKAWPVHVGGTFTDVDRGSLFYRFVETLLHHSITGGCAVSGTSGQFCPGSPTARDQMAVFVLVAREGAGYRPPACTTPVFADLPASSVFCPFVEELARRSVVAGCGSGRYCPSDPVTREQMAVFVLRTLDPTLDPPACASPVFADVPAGSPFCRWIEELARRGVVTGCGGGSYCPAGPVTREQMGVFIGVTFGLTLYGP